MLVDEKFIISRNCLILSRCYKEKSQDYYITNTGYALGLVKDAGQTFFYYDVLNLRLLRTISIINNEYCS